MTSLIRKTVADLMPIALLALHGTVVAEPYSTPSHGRLLTGLCACMLMVETMPLPTHAQLL